MKYFIVDMWTEDAVTRTFLILAVLLIALIPVGMYQIAEEQRQWDAFAEAHHCKVVGHSKGHTTTGVGFGITASGQSGTVITTSTTPDTTGYLCDDGVTYWR